MSLLRSLLFDNLGLKFAALLLAVLVYLNVYTDRPAKMLLTFPIQLTDLADSLSLSGPVPAAVQAELHGPAKHLIRLRVSEPPVRISLAGVGIGRYERALGMEDLPLLDGVQLQLDRLVSPRTLELQVDRRATRRVPVVVAVEGAPAPTAIWNGGVELRPARVILTGPSSAIASLDTVRLLPISIGGRRDTVTIEIGPQGLPDWVTMDPERVNVRVPLESGVTRRFMVVVEPPAGHAGLVPTPARVTAVVIAPRRISEQVFREVKATWRPSGALAPGASRREAVRFPGAPPAGVEVHYEPDSVTARRPSR